MGRVWQVPLLSSNKTNVHWLSSSTKIEVKAKRASLSLSLQWIPCSASIHHLLHQLFTVHHRINSPIFYIKSIQFPLYLFFHISCSKPTNLLFFFKFKICFNLYHIYIIILAWKMIGKQPIDFVAQYKIAEVTD